MVNTDFQSCVAGNWRHSSE